eukprot:TRINITY_DN5948_c1_g1_i2.p1 TRINITY_DN5948_c1_g1~~TRINITY_DN5948_c1_g1_i2.p1  ORF type:complete len:1269 (+),score=243.96 TRINITY_DN5948_c1_g1_i2:949-4755(+)
MDPVESEDYPLVYVSPAFEDFWGYSSDMILGRNDRCMHPRPAAGVHALNRPEHESILAFIKERDDCSKKNSKRRSLTCFHYSQRKDASLASCLSLFLKVAVPGRHPQLPPYVVVLQRATPLKYQAALDELLHGDWSERCARPIEKLRDGLRTLVQGRLAAPTTAPMQGEVVPAQELIQEAISTWILQVARNCKTAWLGNSYAPRVGMAAYDLFVSQEETLRKVLAQAREVLEPLHPEFSELALSRTLQDHPEGLSCTVVDASAIDSPVVYISCGFEVLTGYTRDAVLCRNCRILQPIKEVNQAANEGELRRIAAFCQKSSGVLLCLLLNEFKGGQRFWNLLRLTHAPFNGRKYIVSVTSTLEAPVPAKLWTGTNQVDQVGARALYGRLEQMMSKLSAQHQRVEATAPVFEAKKFVTARIWAFLKTSPDDYVGDIWAPQLNLDASDAFSNDRDVLMALQRLEAKLEFPNLKKNSEFAIAVSDPALHDCPLLYISPGFETLTGYSRQAVLGRNCRVLQPKSREVNKHFNESQFAKLRHFCHPGCEEQSCAFLMVNETRLLRPFLNFFIIERVELQGRGCLVAVSNDLAQMGGAPAELLAGDHEGLRQLERLRDVLLAAKDSLRITGANLNSSLTRCLQEWGHDLPYCMAMPHLEVPGMQSGLPIVGLEVNESTSLDVICDALRTGVRHLHLSFQEVGDVRDRARNEMEGRLMALNLAQKIASLRSQHFHYLRGALTLTIRTPPQLYSAFAEVQKALTSDGYEVVLWLLDVRKAHNTHEHHDHDELSEALQALHAARQQGGVCAIGVVGRSPTAIFTALGSNAERALRSLSVCALELFPGRAFEYADVRALKKLREAGVALMAFSVLGPKRVLLSSEPLRQAAVRLGVDRTQMLIKWAESEGYAVILPGLHLTHGSTGVSEDGVSDDSDSDAGEVSQPVESSTPLSRQMTPMTPMTPMSPTTGAFFGGYSAARRSSLIRGITHSSPMPVVHRQFVRAYYELPEYEEFAHAFHEEGVAAPRRRSIVGRHAHFGNPGRMHKRRHAGFGAGMLQYDAVAIQHSAKRLSQEEHTVDITGVVAKQANPSRRMSSKEADMPHHHYHTPSKKFPASLFSSLPSTSRRQPNASEVVASRSENYSLAQPPRFWMKAKETNGKESPRESRPPPQIPSALPRGESHLATQPAEETSTTPREQRAEPRSLTPRLPKPATSAGAWPPTQGAGALPRPWLSGGRRCTSASPPPWNRLTSGGENRLLRRQGESRMQAAPPSAGAWL